MAAILPLKWQVSYLGGDDYHVQAYYYASIAVIIMAQIAYTVPLRNWVVIDRAKFIGGLLVLAIIVLVWARPRPSRILDFTELQDGEMAGPVIFAIAFPVAHAFLNFAYTSHAKETDIENSA